MSNLKGNGGENEVAKLIKPWWRTFEPDCQFVRTPKSGGWMHGPGFDMCGDLMSNARYWPFSVEVKRQEGWSVRELFKGRASPVWGWWRQCQRDAEKTEREPMLWFRKNYRPWFVIIRRDYATSVAGLRAPDVVWQRRLNLRVDCQEIPVLYLGANVLAHDPRIFARARE